MSGIVLPKRNRVVLVLNRATCEWEVQRGGLVIHRGKLPECQHYCTVHRLTVTNFGGMPCAS